MVNLFYSALLLWPILFFLFVLVMRYLYLKAFIFKTRSIITHYSALPQLTPAEIACLFYLPISHKFDFSYKIWKVLVISEIIHLVNQDVISMKRMEADYQFVFIGKDMNDLNKIDRSLLKFLFSRNNVVTWGKINFDVEKEMEIMDVIYSTLCSLTIKGFLSKKHYYLRLKDVLLVFLPPIIFIIFNISLSGLDNGWAVYLFLSWVSVVIFYKSFIISPLTQKGWQMKAYLHGFKHYLSVVEKVRLNFFHRKWKGGKFDPMFPFIVALGIDHYWIKQLNVNIPQQSYLLAYDATC